MSHLVLELRPGETMLVNGASIRFRNRCRVELASKARFLFGKQILEHQDGASLLEQLYCAIQTLYVGPASDSADARRQIDALLASIGAEANEGMRERAQQVRELLDRGELYASLKLLRPVVRPVSARMPRALDDDLGIHRQTGGTVEPAKASNPPATASWSNVS